jgi:hypothetical protein
MEECVPSSIGHGCTPLSSLSKQGHNYSTENMVKSEIKWNLNYWTEPSITFS